MRTGGTPTAPAVHSILDHKIGNYTSAVRPRVQPTGDARRVCGQELILFGRNRNAALRERVDDVTGQSRAYPVDGRDVELVPCATPQIAQQVRIGLRIDLQLLPVPIVPLVVDDVAENGAASVTIVSPFQQQAVHKRIGHRQPGRIGRHLDHNVVHYLVLSPRVLHTARVIACVSLLGVPDQYRSVLGDGLA